MGEVRGIRSLDGEALRDERSVEQLASTKHVRQKATEPIAAFDVELDIHPPPVKAALRESCGFTAKALGRFGWMFELGGVHPDQSKPFRLTREKDVDGVAVDDLGHRDRRVWGRSR